MNYEQMSDFEINKAVATALPMDWNWQDCSVYCTDGEEFDPCNNPADAWPVILENKISIIHEEEEWYAVHGFYTNLDGEAICEIECSDPTGNPLRAAMIVFLMMQEGIQDAG